MDDSSHILIVDDSMINIFHIGKILKNAGYQVSSVQMGNDALKYVAAQRPDLILLDIMMPDMNGYEVCRRLKESEYSEIPVIFVTAKTDEKDINTGYKVGGEDYIRKPILKQELLARVKVILERYHSTRRYHDLNADLEKIITNRTRELDLLFKIVKLVTQKEKIDEFCQKLINIIENNFRNGAFGICLEYNHRLFESNLFDNDEIIVVRQFRLDTGISVKLQISGKNVTDVTIEEIENFTDLLIVELKHILDYKEIIKIENENKAFFKSVLNGTPDGIVVLNNRKRVIRYNPAFIELFNLNEQDLMGRNINKIIDLKNARFTGTDIFAAINQNGKVYFKLSKQDHKDLTVNCSITGAPLIIDGKKNGYLLVCKDISRRMEIEAKLMSVNKMEAIGQLASGIAHEINSPTQFIRNNVEFINESTQNLIEFSKKINKLLRDEAADLNQFQKELINDIEELDLDFINEETAAAVRESLEGIDRITKIVNAMRTFSHPGNEKKSEVDINEIINKAIIVSRNEWKYDAKIETDLQLDSLVPVYRDKLSQAVLNLIINAAHAIQEQGYEDLGIIKIRTFRKDSDTAEIQVEDNGCGIDESIREKIFEPFFTTKEVGKGTGQGLSVLYNIIVKNHDGRISFKSAPGKGTTFYVCLPINKSEDIEN
ncbi:MAG: response regulator [Fidelibacterota bacterium]